MYYVGLAVAVGICGEAASGALSGANWHPRAQAADIAGSVSGLG